MQNIIVVIFTGLIIFSTACASEKVKEITFNRTEVSSPLKIGKRRKSVKETMIFARIQPYDLYSNYLHRWIDRPLFLSREIRESPNKAYYSFLKDIELVKEYEIDGFTMLGNAYKNRYKNYMRIVDKGKPENFKFMPGLAWAKVPYKQYLENAQVGLKSKYSPRINGKVPFFSYVSMPLPEITKIREKLAKDGCKDILLFDDLHIGYNKPEGRLAKFEKQAQKKLDVVDGLIYANYHINRDPLKDYTISKKFFFDVDEKYYAPLMEKIYSRKKNKGKLLGFNIRHGYIGHMSGTNEAELGTEQLRQAMDTAILFNPDIISLVEWNEANENTSFQPTVYNSKSLQRIIKFYARKLKGLSPEPNLNDDLNIPNLIVSSRQVVALGEKYRIELLNVPDSNSDKKYTVQLTLKDQNNKLIKSFAPDSFIVKKLTAITYTIPSEQIADARAVVPELLITNAKGKKININNLQYTRLSPSICWNFKEVRQPLRDLFTPVKSEFKVSKRKGGGTYQLTGSISANETLNSVEILDNEAEVFAVDRADEFKLDSNYLLTISFSTKKSALRKVSITVPGVNDFILKPWSYPYAGFGKLNKKADTVKGKILFFGHGAKILLLVPKKAKDAKVKFDIDGVGKFEFSVKSVIGKGKIALELPNLTFVKIEKTNKLADHPVSIKSNNANFSATIKPEFNTQCFQLRAITESGKIYRSKPVFTDMLGKKESKNFFSASQGKAVALKVPLDEIIDINYNFTPVYGTLLCDINNTYFDAKLGGGYKYLDPMRFGNLPKDTKTTAPFWIKSDDDWALKFNGISNYIVFPIETLPNGPFTLEFECKTESKDNQVLFRHNSHRSGSLLMYIIDGKLQAQFVSMGRNYRGKKNKLAVDLPFPVGKWVKVKVTYDLHNIKFTVNGKNISIPFKLRAAKPTSAIFGGFSSSDVDIRNKSIKFFKGQLRSLRIRHNVKN
jgi:Concanavalin A-like lectin/glucanases superfamily